MSDPASSLTRIPTSPTRTLNAVKIHHSEEVALFERECVESRQTAQERMRRPLEPHL